MPHYDDDPEEESSPPRRRVVRRDELMRAPRRESLMARRLRRARGEEVDDDLDEPYVPLNVERTVPYGIPMVSGGCAATALYVALGAITVVVLLMLFWQQIVAAFVPNVPQQVVQLIATPTPTIRDWGGAIQQMKNLNRLETQRFSIERVVEASTARGDALDMFLGERLLLIASGDVVAGVDLSKLTDRDVIISPDGASVTLTLPASEIFSARLDNERTRVYDRQTRLITQLTGGQNPNLETQARQEAERQILAAACENGIMQRAAEEAKRSMEQFLRLLEFENVTVIATAGACVIED
ncbi:DUF4230 domain-containing protein [Roseiflexus sp.]|uniref:DUF4230 domain-containing protein n=1 Tax=Roseiflexus sp. TaxID=2562120 RepID=UPI0021DC2139|nr:DUF4230 domain-containing protein [Roseiflexus sp.]GIW00252.1 MAG: hypothetical protein KatS3mg058_1655 [Roseiflexus sp.]